VPARRRDHALVCDRRKTVHRWSVVVFIVADVEQMRTLRAVAVGALALALLVTVGAALIALYLRKRN
jgi:hypothetical protein